MDFKAAREAMNLTLKEASKLARYSVPTINALELEGRGSPRLKARLTEIYTGEKSDDTSELQQWRRRAEAAEAELLQLHGGLRELITKSSSAIARIVDEQTEIEADMIRGRRKAPAESPGRVPPA